MIFCVGGFFVPPPQPSVSFWKESGIEAEGRQLPAVFTVTEKEGYNLGLAFIPAPSPLPGMFSFSFLLCFCVRICASGCGRKCKETPLELLFVIDSSESVGLKNFQIIKNFVKTLTDRVALDLATTRIGIINYSHKVEEVAHLTQFSSKDDLKQAVDDMQYLGEGTYTATALHAANRMFEAAKPGVKKVALVITDGQTDTRDKKNLTEVVKNASDINVEIFVIGVVKRNDPNFHIFHQEMNLIATDPDSEHVYLFDDFITLEGKTVPGEKIYIAFPRTTSRDDPDQK